MRGRAGDFVDLIEYSVGGDVEVYWVVIGVMCVVEVCVASI